MSRPDIVQDAIGWLASGEAVLWSDWVEVLEAIEAGQITPAQRGALAVGIAIAVERGRS